MIKHYLRSKRVRTLLMLLLAFVGVFSIFIFSDSAEAPEDTQVTTTEQQTVVNESPVTIETPQTETVQFDTAALQATLDSWQQQIRGTAGVVIADSSGRTLASSNPDRSYFAASIYKLYVAYEGYKQVDAGSVDLNEQYVNGHTRGECLDLMIRESDSPCGEKLWGELGRESLTNTMQSYGITQTDMVSLRTTAADAATMLARIARGESLSEESKKAFMQSMKDQKFRDALNKGFSSDTTVYNKIGFNELVEYHDVAIVEFLDRRQLIVSVLTEGVGTTQIAKLGSLIEQAIR